jgi:hypothetical protein
MSGRSSKRKGYGFEVELVKAAEAAGLLATRAWGSNGRALGESEGTDCVIGGFRVQAKRRAVLAEYLYPPPGTEAVILRADKREALVVIPFEEWLHLLCERRHG